MEKYKKYKKKYLAIKGGNNDPFYVCDNNGKKLSMNGTKLEFGNKNPLIFHTETDPGKIYSTYTLANSVKMYLVKCKGGEFKLKKEAVVKICGLNEDIVPGIDVIMAKIHYSFSKIKRQDENILSEIKYIYVMKMCAYYELCVTMIKNLVKGEKKIGSWQDRVDEIWSSISFDVDTSVTQLMTTYGNSDLYAETSLNYILSMFPPLADKNEIKKINKREANVFIQLLVITGLQFISRDDVCEKIERVDVSSAEQLPLLKMGEIILESKKFIEETIGPLINIEIDMNNELAKKIMSKLHFLNYYNLVNDFL